MLFSVIAILIAPGFSDCARRGNQTTVAGPVAFDDLSDGLPKTQIEQLAALGVFGPLSGHFEPGGPIIRGEFIRWLFLTSNAIWADDPGKQIRPADGSRTTFPDVPPSQPDYKYIQGFVDAGFAIGFQDKLFHPTEPLTREQMIAIKESVDRGGVESSLAHLTIKDVNGAYSYMLPDWKDRDQIAPEYWPAIATDVIDDGNAAPLPNLYPGATIDNLPRAFGAIAMFYPKRAVTRAEAAVCIWRIGPHAAYNKGPARSAADALAPSPSPSPTP